MQLFDRYFFGKSSSIEFIYIYYLCWYNFLLYSDGIKTNIDFVLCYELITLVYIIMRDKFKYSSQITTTVRLVLLFKHFLFFKVSWHLKLLPVQHLGFDVCELWPLVLQFPGSRSNEFANIWPRVLSLLAPTTKVIYFICGVFLNDTISSM